MKREWRVIGIALAFAVIAGCSTVELGNQAEKAAVDQKAFDTTGWTLAWSDEFNGSSVNTSVWNFDTGNGSWGWGNGELQYYQSQNATVSGGYLNITAKKESVGGMSFTSARLNTKGKYSVQYGKIAARIKSPYGKGMWPAFWMLGTSGATWPANGEIDIFELAGGQNDAMTYSTCHWDSGGHASYGKTYTHSAALSGDFHVYEVEWDSTYIRAKFDGIEYYVIDISPADLSELRAPFYIILNLAIGGQFFSPALFNVSDITAPFPQTMQVDWVRVYTKGGTATVTPTPTATPAVTPTPTPTPTAGSTFTYGASYSGTTATLWFKPTWTASYVNPHYKLNSGTQQNVTATYNSSTARWEKTITGVASGTKIDYYFTYEKSGLAYDTAWYTYTAGTAATATPTPTPTATPSGTAISIPGTVASSVGAVAAGASKSWSVKNTAKANFRIQVTLGGTANGQQYKINYNGTTVTLSGNTGQTVNCDFANVAAGTRTLTITAVNAINLSKVAAVTY